MTPDQAAEIIKLLAEIRDAISGAGMSISMMLLVTTFFRLFR